MSRLTYKKAGVDVNKANIFIRKALPFIKTTNIPGAIGTVGGFGGLFKPCLKGYKEPIFVSSTDGVGTKLKIAFMVNKHNTVGIDLVAMNVNDILCVGAKPLFFLDYIATAAFDMAVMLDVIKGIARGCREAGCALVGGETAQMPAVYKKGEYDLAGFCVGVVDRKELIDNSKVKIGDRIIGIESNGLHSNGFSLVRKVFTHRQLASLSHELLKPTQIYVRPVLGLRQHIFVKAIAHITGGGYRNKVRRILSKGIDAVIYKNSWHVPKIFRTIQEKGKISNGEMFKTFNMGVGMVVVVNKKDAKDTIRYFSKHRLKSWDIGRIEKGNGEVKII